MEYEETKRKLEGMYGWVEAVETAMAKLRKDLLWVSFAIGVPTAASDSPSQSKSEKPSEPSTCEAGESAELECPKSITGKHRSPAEHCVVCNIPLYEVAGESAPRKVWAVQFGDDVNRLPYRFLIALFSSREAAERCAGKHPFVITEYEVADD